MRIEISSKRLHPYYVPANGKPTSYVEALLTNIPVLFAPAPMKCVKTRNKGKSIPCEKWAASKYDGCDPYVDYPEPKLRKRKHRDVRVTKPVRHPVKPKQTDHYYKHDPQHEELIGQPLNDVFYDSSGHCVVCGMHYRTWHARFFCLCNLDYYCRCHYKYRDVCGCWWPY